MKKNIQTIFYRSEIGTIRIAGTTDSVTVVEFLKNEPNDQPVPIRQNPTCPYPPLGQCITQLDEYFRGERTKFSLPLTLIGTPFQKKVWNQLQKIPYGKTASYKDVAVAIDNPKGMRAVGGANGKNPISIIIPCHRVIAHDGSIGGYGGGLWRKEWLLKHEQEVLSQK